MNLECLTRGLNLNKDDWQPVEFGSVAIQKKTSVDRESTDIVHYVKGEHMCSEDLHLRDWGELKDEYLGPAFIRKFEEGDILYGSRRTYLRKVAIAPFRGITSNTTFVIKPNEKLIDKRLLPFVMLSEGFATHSIRNSKGSVNPYVNWKDIANYEFFLPPKENQAELAELLLSTDNVIEREITLIKELELLLHSQIEEKMHGLEMSGKSIQQLLKELSRKKGTVELGDCGDILKGKGIAKVDLVAEGIPCIRYGELYTKHDRIVRQYYSFISDETASRGLKLKKNDVLFAGSGETVEEIGKSAAFIGREDVYAGSDTLVFRPHDMDGAYLGYLMNSQIVRQQLNRYGTGATVIHIYPDDLKRILVPKIDKKTQINIAQGLELIYENINHAKTRRFYSKKLLKSLINEVF